MCLIHIGALFRYTQHILKRWVNNNFVSFFFCSSSYQQIVLVHAYLDLFITIAVEIDLWAHSRLIQLLNLEFAKWVTEQKNALTKQWSNKIDIRITLVKYIVNQSIRYSIPFHFHSKEVLYSLFFFLMFYVKAEMFDVFFRLFCFCNGTKTIQYIHKNTKN